jgi:hypothetical protein
VYLNTGVQVSALIKHSSRILTAVLMLMLTLLLLLLCVPVVPSLNRSCWTGLAWAM